MTQRTFFQKLRAKLAKEYKVVVIDEKSMTQSYTANFTWWKVICMATLFALIVCIISVLLFTQTGLIRFLGPLPKSLVGMDYKNLAIKIDSLESLSQAREKKFKAIQALITKGISSPDTLQDDSKEEVVNNERIIPVIKEVDKKMKAALLPAMPFIKPVSGEITSKFDLQRYHYGIDLAAKSDSPILAVASGYVLASGYTRENGNTVWIMHAQGYLSSYKHNARINVFVGQYVQQGDQIAIIGNTGESSTGPHLHFELWNNNKPIDPDTMIKL